MTSQADGLLIGADLVGIEDHLSGQPGLIHLTVGEKAVHLLAKAAPVLLQNLRIALLHRIHIEWMFMTVIWV